MDIETLRWIRMLHIFGMVTWVGALTGLSYMLAQHVKAAQGARADLVALEGTAARAMDIGATIAIATGVAMLVGIKPSLLKGQGYMHAKLLLVVIFIGLHGLQRVRTAKYKRGEVTPSPAWIIPAVHILAFAIIVLVTTKLF